MNESKKKVFTVYIEEKLCKGTEIEADTMEEAEEKAIEMYRNSEIILDSNDMGTDPSIMVTENDGSDSTDWHEF